MPLEEITARLGRYKGLPLPAAPRPVTDAQVEQALQTLRLRAAQWAPSPAPAARGDRVILDFAGFDDAGAPIPESSMEQVELVLGSGRLLRGAEQAIAGHCAGERFSISVTYPADFRVAALAGRQACFAITLHEVRRKVLPPADDAFASAAGYADLAALRAALRAERQALHARTADQANRQRLLQQVAGEMTVEFPAGLLDRQAGQKLQQLERQLRAAGQDPAEYFRREGRSRAWYLADLRAAAERELRRRLAVRELARAEGLTVAPEEIEAEYARLSAARAGTDAGTDAGADPALTRDTVREALLTRKAQQLLLEYAARPQPAPAVKEE